MATTPLLSSQAISRETASRCVLMRLASSAWVGIGSMTAPSPAAVPRSASRSNSARSLCRTAMVLNSNTRVVNRRTLDASCCETAIAKLGLSSIMRRKRWRGSMAMRQRPLASTLAERGSPSNAEISPNITPANIS